MMMMEKMKPQRWAELEEEGEDNNLDFLLPPRQVIGPDKDGIKKVIEFKYGDHGQILKVTTTLQARKLMMSEAAAERREWAKFEDAVDEDVGARLTMVSSEDIFLERPRLQAGFKQEEAKVTPQTVLMICRICKQKGDHWTSRCPYKDLTTTAEDVFDKSPMSKDVISAPTKSNTYVPPNKRTAAERPPGAEMKRRNEENTLRVNNLSEDTREADLHELFCPFGLVSRVYMPIDQKTGMSRGFGFVNFVNRKDAEEAISRLNGHGYDSLILRVEWAAPRTN